VQTRFTPKQGQYLAFIHAYTRLAGRPPAEADMQRHFQVTPPTVHQMVLRLEQLGLIKRTPGKARSIECESAPKVDPGPIGSKCMTLLANSPYRWGHHRRRS
jgi:DNA-binding MarR family transcriptional regulator